MARGVAVGGVELGGARCIRRDARCTFPHATIYFYPELEKLHAQLTHSLFPLKPCPYPPPGPPFCPCT